MFHDKVYSSSLRPVLNCYGKPTYTEIGCEHLEAIERYSGVIIWSSVFDGDHRHPKMSDALVL